MRPSNAPRASYAGRPTAIRHGIRPASRSPRIVSPTFPSRATASRCSTTANTATTHSATRSTCSRRRQAPLTSPSRRSKSILGGLKRARHDERNWRQFLVVEGALMAHVVVNKLVKKYGELQVVHGIDFEINDGEFVVLV